MEGGDSLNVSHQDIAIAFQVLEYTRVPKPLALHYIGWWDATTARSCTFWERGEWGLGARS